MGPSQFSEEPVFRQYYAMQSSPGQPNQDSYLQVIFNLESQNLLEEYTANQLKNLILEENGEVFRLINNFMVHTIDEQTLCSKLNRLA